MASTKSTGRNYWLKMTDSFFDSKLIRRLAKEKNGDSLVVIFLSSALATIKNDGVFEFERIEDTIEAELATTINRDAEEVKKAVELFCKIGCFEPDEDNIYIPFVSESMNSTSTSTDRSRKCREKKRKEKNLLDTETAPLCNAATKECNTGATPCNAEATACNTTASHREEEEKREEKEEKRADEEEDFSAATKSITTEVISALNTKTGAQYTTDDTNTLGLVDALIAQGYTQDDLLHVIDVKVDEWLPVPKMAPLLKPSTLFGPKFADYIKQPRAIRKEPTTSFSNPFDIAIDSVFSGGD